MSGRKFDGGKLRWAIMPWDALTKVMEVLEYGARKYDLHNWQGLADFELRYESALIRHYVAWKAGEENDPESGLSHLAHMACNVLFLIWKGMQSKKQIKQKESTKC